MTVAIVTPWSQFNTWLLLEFVARRENGVCAYCSVQLKSITLVQLFLTLALTVLCLLGLDLGTFCFTAQFPTD